MKKLLFKWQDASYLKKTVILLLAIILIVLLSYIACGCPPLSAKMALRQEEKRNMIGPSQIIAEFQQESHFYNEVIVGRTEHIYTLFAYDQDERISNFVWYERTENTALYAVPGTFPITSPIATPMPLNLILFDTEPKAKRAEIELEITYQHNETYTKFLSAQAVREHDGFFLFSFYCQDTGVSSVNQAALLELQELCSEYYTQDLPVTVRYYDAKGTLIRTETIFAGPTA